MPPSQRAADIPQVLSDLVMKLLAKAAEDRYQSAAGLRADLQECLRRWQAGREIAQFPLGRSDIGGTLRIPPRLYGWAGGYGRAAFGARPDKRWRRRAAGRSMEELLAAPRMTVPELLIVSRLLMELMASAYFTSPTLFALLATRMVNLTQQHGNCETSAYGYHWLYPPWPWR